MTHDKCLESIRLNLPDQLRHDLQDLAAQEDRALSELIRIILRERMYSLAPTLCRKEPDRYRDDR